MKELADELSILKYAGFDTLDGTPVTRLDIVELLAGLPGFQFEVTENCSFTDCGESTPTQKGMINAAVEYKITMGIGEDTFSPDRTIGRSEAAAFIFWYLGIFGTAPDIKWLPEFADVEDGTWYYDSVAALYSAGIIDKLAELEEKVGGPAEVAVPEELTDFDPRNVSVVGASFNKDNADEEISIVIDTPEDPELAIPELYSSTLSVSFSMVLTVD